MLVLVMTRAPHTAAGHSNFTIKLLFLFLSHTAFVSHVFITDMWYLPVSPTFLRHIKHLFLLDLALSFVSADVPASASASGCLKLSLSPDTLPVDEEGLTSAAPPISSLAGRWELHGSSDNPTMIQIK